MRSFTIVNPLLLPHDYRRSPYGKVSDLRHLLAEQHLSPEQLAERTGVSNMTWRRLLSKPDTSRMPEKYSAVLERQFAPAPPELDGHQIALAGFGGSEAAVLKRVAEDAGSIESESRLLRDVERKRRSVRGLPEKLATALATLVERLPKAPLAAKALILGALVYFLNPLDLVADALLGIGFLDDAGVVAIVLKKLSRTTAGGAQRA